MLKLKHSMNLAEIRKSVFKDIETARNVKALEQVKGKYVGRQDGALTIILRSLKDMSPAEKKKVGPEANVLREEIEQALDKKLKEFEAVAASRGIDVTMPGKKVAFGHLHPLTLVEQKIREIFRSLNFSVVEGPEVETEYYNFDALNIPANHPARDMWDTFWVAPSQDRKPTTAETRRLLRTHTSPVQVHYMEKHQPPFQIIVPGRCFRYEATDASHEINFHQIEGLMVGPDVQLTHFKYLLTQFFQRLFGAGVEIRFRPSYFPFTEPSFEVDIKLNNKWLEVMGAGMVHPNVFKAVRYNPKQVQGFAFGMGLERLAMIKFGITDIRLFYSGDLRFINQF